MNLAEWKHKRILKGLGPLEPQEVERSERYMERRSKADAMPEMWLERKPIEFHACRWLTGWRELPKVHGRLQGGVK